jgi:hypothetical protein
MSGTNQNLMFNSGEEGQYSEEDQEAIDIGQGRFGKK